MLELLIKIPEDVYTRLFDNGIQDNEIAVDDICEMERALRMGTPLENHKTGRWIVLEQTYEKGQIDVLENIKTEIKEEQKRILTLDNGQYYVALCDFQKLLDKHIEELKGGTE